MRQQPLALGRAGFLLLVLAGGCPAGGGRQIISSSEGERPLWLQQCPAPDKENLVFCGEARGRLDIDSACGSAYADALGKLTRYVGQQVAARLEPDGRGGYRFTVQGAGSSSTVRGVWEDQRWYESYRQSGATLTDCWVMLLYPRLEYENLVNLARQALFERVKRAAGLRKEAAEQAGQGCQAEALGKLELARKMLADIREPVSVPGVGDSDSLARQVQAEWERTRREYERTGKTVLVELGLQVEKRFADPNLRQRLATQVAQWLQARGFVVKPGRLTASARREIAAGSREAALRAVACRGAGWLALVELRSQYLGEEDGIHFAKAGGSFRLLRSLDGRVLRVAELTEEKQGHPRTARQAVRLSLEKLAQRGLRQAIFAALEDWPR